MFPKEHRRLRKAGKVLVNKILETYIDEDILKISARALNMGQNRQLFFETEDEMSIFMDFILYEVRKDGENMVYRYQEEKGGMNHAERELLASMVKAKTGLFKVDSVLPKNNCLELHELVGDRKILLTDINLSQTAIHGIILFLRPLELINLIMTSGIAFAFPEEMESILIKRWAGGDSADRYVRFFKLSRSKGIKTRFV